eukprot:EG_transcript_3088
MARSSSPEELEVCDVESEFESDDRSTLHSEVGRLGSLSPASGPAAVPPPPPEPPGRPKLAPLRLDTAAVNCTADLEPPSPLAAKAGLLDSTHSNSISIASGPPGLPGWPVLLRPAARWSGGPLGLLGAALVALFFAEGQRPSPGAMAILAAVGGAFILFFGLAMALEIRRLLKTVGQSLPTILRCNADQLDTVVSTDGCVRYLQLAAHAAHTQAGDGGDEADGSDLQLRFLRPEMEAREDAADGHIILDRIGTILWCNEALSRYFKYEHGALLSENVRMLMPHPYNGAHDSLIRKYDRHGTVKKIVGCTRHVPVIDRDGRDSQVFLSVEERRDPKDETHYLFLGKMVWPKEQELHISLQARVDEGVPLVQACEAVKTDWTSFLVIDARGQILFANNGICNLLQWSRPELQGKNIAVLMNPEVGEGHTALLERYIRRVEGALARGTEPPMSSTVGKGRDLYARCRTGEYLRTWVVVERIEAPSRRPADCCFVGMMIYIQGQEQRRAHHLNPVSGRLASHKDRQRRTPSYSPRKSVVSDLGAPLTALLGVAKKKCTVVAFDFYGAATLEMEALAVEYQKFANLLTAACHRNSGVLHSPLGDRVLVSLNLVVPNLSQRSAAGLIMQQVLQGHHAAHPSPHVELRAAAACGDAVSATHHRQPVLISDSVDLCACMLSMAHEARVKYGLIDPTLYEELQYAYECRLINVVTLFQRHGAMRRVPLYELYSVKELDENEWMYQIQAQQKTDSLAAWRECWAHLCGNGNVRPDQLAPGDPQAKCDQALACLERHLDVNHNAAADGPALWLRRVLHRRRQQFAPGPRTVQVFGKLRCLLHYTLEERLEQGTATTNITPVVAIA